MTNPERWWLLALVLAVCLPILLLARGHRPEPPQPDHGLASGIQPAVGAAEPLPPELRIDPAELDVIRDNTLERPEERDVFLHLLGVLKRAEPGQLQRASIGRITYAQLRRQPNQYRGKLVTVQGTVRRVIKAQPPHNQQGIDRYYQLWIEPADAPSWPMVVVCLELPPEFPSGAGVAEEVAVTGFFFKRWAYQAQDQLRTVPTLLARTVGWEKPATPVPPQPPLPWTSLLIGGSGILVIGAWFVWRWCTRTPSHRGSPPASPDFSTLEQAAPAPATDASLPKSDSESPR
jgi:hypothetical protein